MIEEATEPPTRAPNAFDVLTPREKEVAHALALGDTNAEIARRLKISQKTVDTHRTHVMKKLDVRNNVKLAHLAIGLGFVELES